MRSEPLDVSADLSVSVSPVSPVSPVFDHDLTATPDDGLRGAADGDTRPIVAAGEQREQAPEQAAEFAPEFAPEQAPGAAPRRSGRVARFFAEIPLALVIAGVGAGLAVIAMHHFRWGSLAISASVLVGGVFRLVLPTRKAGLLVVRSRFTDVIVMGFLGGALMVLAAVTST